jgi:hypothetical protein
VTVRRKSGLERERIVVKLCVPMMNRPHALISLLAPVALLTVTARAEVDFVHQVVPILKKHCSECHGGEEAKGGFSINTRNLFLDDATAAPGDAAGSYFLELIEETDPDMQMPPEKKERVAPEHIAILKQWVNEGMKWEPGFTFGVTTYEPPLQPRLPELPPVTEGRTNPVDRFIDHHLAANDLPRPAAIDDSTFLRRVSLDLIGLAPAPDEVTAFLEDKDPDKRSKLVNELLAREISYADHWLTFWNDLLRNDYTGTGFITGGRTQISRWLYDALKTNKAFDAMTRELIAPISAESDGFIKGITWRGEVSAGQTVPIQFSQSISQSFLGINMKCASCHDSFIDRWKLSEAYGLAAIYAETPLEIHRCDKPVGETAKASWLFPEIGQVDPAAPRAERLRQLADLMVHPENGRTTRTIVNRLWGQLMGRGIVHPLDAMQTEPWHIDLLDYLASDFQENGYDLKHTLALIATSAAYQSQAEVSLEEDDGGDYTYRGPRAKRLSAEQFVDLLWSLTGTAPKGFNAPVVRGIADPEAEARSTHPSSWIWGPSAANGDVPGGEKILLRRIFTPAKPVRSAGVVAAADNSYSLYLNGQLLTSGTDWSVLQSAPAFVKGGANTLLLVAENGTTAPNPAGAYAAMRLLYEDGSDEVIFTDASWEVSAKVPAGANVARWELDKLTWEKAVPVSLGPWSGAVDPQIATNLAAVSAGAPLMVRAGLVQSDFLMRSLGRPNRDQIVTSRPNELTTLEAIDLSNDATIAKALEAGAAKLVAAHGKTPDRLIDELYLSTLTRLPNEDERTVLREVLGENPEPQTVADLTWSLWMMPEYLLVR